MTNTDSAMSEPGAGDNDDLDMILDPKVQESIGRSLKAHYDDIINAPVPDKFLVLLAQLEATEQRASGVSSDERE
ncbi:NepR family anti-sigma factor [Bosea sp. (in: a-proteobacteria)]|uniref:NepR family anti-sigma factor n=1 Tax=Bosea sp. (in: a-proteobacteria) TaxID=1871050 RepID=UPI003B3A8539